MPQVLNRRRGPSTHQFYNGQKAGVDVGRTSKWGNPFKMRKEADRAQVIEKYWYWLADHPEIVTAARRELRGRSLICWCAPEMCHADILFSIANE